MRYLFILLLVIIITGSAFSQQMVHIQGCGDFPAVQIIVDNEADRIQGFIRSSRTFIPARDVMERLGGTMVWDNSINTVYAKFPKQMRTVRFKPGSRSVTVYRYDSNSGTGAGEVLSRTRLITAPFICNGTIYAPVRAASEAVGGKVDYDKSTKTVHIYSPQKS